MPISGGCVIGKYPGFAAAKQVAGQVIQPGAWKFIGYNALAGKAAGAGAGAGLGAKGLCLGLGLGLGAWGPLLLIGAGIAGGYLFFKNNAPSVKLDDEDNTPVAS
jgi:hypothetical protein